MNNFERLQEAMSKIGNIFEKTTGYKTYLAGGLLIILNGIKLIWPNSIGQEWYQWVQDLLLFVGGVGIGDKARRSINK